MNKFELEVSNLSCSLIPSLFNRYDRIHDFSYSFTSGKIYCLVGSLGKGNWAASYLLSGKSSFDEILIFKIGRPILFENIPPLGHFSSESSYS
jgi:hypothetical protein